VIVYLKGIFFSCFVHCNFCCGEGRSCWRLGWAWKDPLFQRVERRPSKPHAHLRMFWSKNKIPFQWLFERKTKGKKSKVKALPTLKRRRQKYSLHEGFLAHRCRRGCSCKSRPSNKSTRRSYKLQTIIEEAVASVDLVYVACYLVAPLCSPSNPNPNPNSGRSLFRLRSLTES
jgi:hypothetical protein